MYIYEAGALSIYRKNNQIEKGLNWRKELDTWANDHNIRTFNPGETYLREINHNYDPKIVVSQNDYYIDKCDICVVNLDDIDYSPGTIYEMVRFMELRKPVISFGKKHISPHINFCIDHQCGTLDDVIELLENMFGV